MGFELALTITLQFQMQRLTKLLNHKSVRLAHTAFIFGSQLTLVEEVLFHPKDFHKIPKQVQHFLVFCCLA